MKNLHRVTNRHIQNFLGAHNVWPVIDDEQTGEAFYRKTAKFKQLLESFEIQNYCFKNRK